MVSVYMNSIFLSKLSVYSTTEVKEMSDVHKVAVDIVNAYVELNQKKSSVTGSCYQEAESLQIRLLEN